MISRLESSVVSLPSVSASDCDVLVAKIVSKLPTQSSWIKTNRLLVPDREFDGDSHSIPLDDVPIGDEESRIEDGEPEVQRKPVFYGDKDLECKIFPCDYPYGKGGYHVSLYKENKAHTMSPSHYLKARLRSPDPRWRRNRVWCNFQFDLMEKRRIHETQGVMFRPGDPTHSGKTLRLIEAAAADSRSSDIKRHFLPSSVSGSAAYYRSGAHDTNTHTHTHTYTHTGQPTWSCVRKLIEMGCPIYF